MVRFSSFTRVSSQVEARRVAVWGGCVCREDGGGVGEQRIAAEAKAGKEPTFEGRFLSDGVLNPVLAPPS